jgi:hypothetical protein
MIADAEPRGCEGRTEPSGLLSNTKIVATSQLLMPFTMSHRARSRLSKPIGALEIGSRLERALTFGMLAEALAGVHRARLGYGPLSAILNVRVCIITTNQANSGAGTPLPSTCPQLPSNSEAILFQGPKRSWQPNYASLETTPVLP